ncbi:hypothetical protein ACHAXM_010021, partial [Skeletonema potamos]
NKPAKIASKEASDTFTYLWSQRSENTYLGTVWSLKAHSLIWKVSFPSRAFYLVVMLFYLSIQ